jgi:hypothetical protein
MVQENTPQNGRDRLEEAMALLIQNQAAFVGRLAENERTHLDFERRHLEFERKHLEFERETAERFARIEGQMAEIIRVLSEHGEVMQRLSDAVREKIGFKRAVRVAEGRSRAETTVAKAGSDGKSSISSVLPAERSGLCKMVFPANSVRLVASFCLVGQENIEFSIGIR